MRTGIRAGSCTITDRKDHFFEKWANKKTASSTGSCHEYCFFPMPGSNDKQGIAVAKEPVLIFDRLLVGFHGQLIASKSAGHDQQACFR